MIKITEAIKQIIEQDEEALIALQRGIINFSSYARSIQKEVEDITKKSVETRSIVVALSRFSNTLTHTKLEPPVKVLHVSIHSDLEELSYERTKACQQVIQAIYKDIPHTQAFFTATQGVTEITIIGEQKVTRMFKKALHRSKPLYTKQGLSGITVKFPREYLSVPNVIFSLTKRLAVKQINLIELVSTLTELTFIIDKNDTQRAVNQLTQGYV